MAYRRSNGKGRRKLEPAVLEMVFNLPAGTRYIDLNQVNSLMNRRFYRQGLQNAISSIEVQFTPNPGQTSATGSVVISKLPTTWIMSNAWMKGFKAWQRLNNEAMTESESVRPKFLDFKIYADADHHSLGFDANLKPTNLSALTAIPATGEWESSKYVIPKTDGTDDINSREILATGASYPGPGASTLNAVSLIEGYAASRGLPDIMDPNTPADARDAAGTAPENWMQALFNEGTEQDDAVLTDLTSENNSAPYPFENGPIQGFPGTQYTDTMYPGGANQLPGLQIHDRLLITTSTIGGSDTAVGGVFPCGLIRFDTDVENGSAIVIVRQIPGPHRGYLCAPMTEM